MLSLCSGLPGEFGDIGHRIFIVYVHVAGGWGRELHVEGVMIAEPEGRGRFGGRGCNSSNSSSSNSTATRQCIKCDREFWMVWMSTGQQGEKRFTTLF